MREIELHTPETGITALLHVNIRLLLIVLMARAYPGASSICLSKSYRTGCRMDFWVTAS